MLSEHLDTWLNRHRLLVDAVVAGGLALVLGLGAAGLGVLQALLSVVLIVPLAWRRTRPVPSAAVVLTMAFVHWWLLLGEATHGIVPADLVVPFSVYSVTTYGPRWAGRVAMAAGVFGAGLAALGFFLKAGATTSDAVATFVTMAASVLAASAFGTLRGVRRERVEALTDRARLLEVEQQQQARLAVQAERARIAREMHDVVAHSLAVMIAQADGGRYAAAASPRAAEESLRNIGETGRRALAEMRRLLGVLRDEGDMAAAQARLPQPGLTDLPALVEQVRAGGLPVSLHQEGRPCPVAQGLELVMYRIVQEGLTNVIKHAGPAARAEVTVRWGPRTLEIDVLDDGRGAGVPPGPGGHGLIGMSERAAAYGGTVHAGPRPGGGHALHATIPVAA
jgi:signal transduction histidine kinase